MDMQPKAIYAPEVVEKAVFQYGEDIFIEDGKIIWISDEVYIVCRDNDCIHVMRNPAPHKHIPKCDPSRDGRHVTFELNYTNCTEEESGRMFEFRNCIHCGVGIETETGVRKVLKADPPPAGVKSMAHLVTDLIRKQSFERNTALEGFAKHYCEAMGLTPDKVELVVRTFPNETIYSFRERVTS